ncbi:MAG TPA: PEP-CTERM sorting domain-containing protein [Myxococcota bacterium]|nr:PEP-CTERM sorting domain-containing protein [Myxococcota bacterium]
MRLGLAIALLVLASGATARAKTVEVDFEGILSLASGIAGADAGTGFSGSYSYDDGAALQLLGPGSGMYSFGSGFPASGFRIAIHGTSPVEFSGAPLRDISVTDADSGDSLAVVAETGANGDFRLDLMGGAGLLPSLGLGAPDLSQGSGLLQYTNLESGFVLLMGSLTSLAVVPEPPDSLLLALGIAALAVRQRKRS